MKWIYRGIILIDCNLLINDPLQENLLLIGFFTTCSDSSKSGGGWFFFWMSNLLFRITSGINIEQIEGTRVIFKVSCFKS